MVELIISLSALAVIVLGHSIVSYHAKLDIGSSVKQSTAAMVALLLCESWAGADGAVTYDPVSDLASGFTISGGSGPSAPAGFTSLGSYFVAVDGTCYHATLSSKALASTLRALNVSVAWSDRGGDPPTLDKEFCLTTYVLLD
ncbi:MAG: hypothetical protein A2Y76_10305 [Planctomycetes bacterium RBG_13_60_9]|nr:MAG: hypothetical protein A2Y76_10305 [Planctomycetes bacterium RBG_13_60_9]